jgi:hypothetical protein
MLKKFVAQSLVETRATDDRSRFELTFVDANGDRQAVSLPMSLASDLAPVLLSFANSAMASSTMGGAHLTKMPKEFSVGHARYERLVLVKFDDDPPYALGLEEARALSRGMLDESETASRFKEPALQ